jgi:hypothetical protein
VEEGPPDFVPAGSRRDPQVGCDTKAVGWLSGDLAGEIHDRVETVGMQSDVADEVAADLGFPGADRTRRGDEKPKIARELGRIAIELVNDLGESLTALEIHIRAWPHDHVHTIAQVPTSPARRWAIGALSPAIVKELRS